MESNCTCWSINSVPVGANQKLTASRTSDGSRSMSSKVWALSLDTSQLTTARVKVRCSVWLNHRCARRVPARIAASVAVVILRTSRGKTGMKTQKETHSQCVRNPR